MDLIATPLEEDEVEEDKGCKALTDANDTDIETAHSTISESETDEEGQSLLVSRFERLDAPAVFQGSPVWHASYMSACTRMTQPLEIYLRIYAKTHTITSFVGSCRRRN